MVEALTALGIAVVVALIFFGGLVWLQKRGSIDPSGKSADETGDDEQSSVPDAARDDSDTFNLPLRSRVAAWSIHMKLFAAFALAVALIFGYVGVQLMRSGGSNEYLTIEVVAAGCAFVGLVTGVKTKSWFDDQIGRVITLYENDEGPPRAEAKPYLKSSLRGNEGLRRVTYLARGRLFGLFWRVKLRGEVPKLRTGNKPLNEEVTAEVPEHGAEIMSGLDGYVVPTQKDGDKYITKAGEETDITYRTRNSLSTERSAKLRKQNHRLRQMLGAQKADNAQKDIQLEKFKKRLENEEYDSREAMREDFMLFVDIMSDTPVREDHAPGNVIERAEQEGAK